MKRNCITAIGITALAISCTTRFDVEGDVGTSDTPDVPHDVPADAVPDGMDVPGEPPPDVVPDGPGIVRPVDMLFVVDNSMSMIEEQARMREAFPALIAGILDPPSPTRPVTDLHVGVVSTDMGTGSHELETCPDPVDGDDGVLLHEPSDEVSGCDTSYPPFLGYASETPDPGAIDWISQGFACIASLGIDGCGFEQQLKASTRALIDHRDGANAGFLREDSIVVVVYLSDEDDCSIAAGSEGIFDPLDSSLGHLALRCFNHSYMLESITTYIDGLQSIRPSSPDLLTAFIVGVPRDPACEGQGNDITGCLMHEAMTEAVDPGSMTELLPACQALDAGTKATPARRFVLVAQDLSEQAFVQSICSPDYGQTVEWLMARIGDLAGD
jgi:hypothetical protein